ncbi:MAG: hypothetical protein GX859_06530 [Corynebacterium humireducens]|uniref:Uncharacterized protein n=1 Tax=Corynebacterium humireducens TaxID=1223514 RepID=A0A7X6PN17_9CORY|nr:hypothetical protein [Corynebacterium humireducens]
MDDLVRELLLSRGIPVTEGEAEVLAERHRALREQRPPSPGPEAWAGD